MENIILSQEPQSRKYWKLFSILRDFIRLTQKIHREFDLVVDIKEINYGYQDIHLYWGEYYKCTENPLKDWGISTAVVYLHLPCEHAIYKKEMTLQGVKKFINEVNKFSSGVF